MQVAGHRRRLRLCRAAVVVDTCHELLHAAALAADEGLGQGGVVAQRLVEEVGHALVAHASGLGVAPLVAGEVGRRAVAGAHHAVGHGLCKGVWAHQPLRHAHGAREGLLVEKNGYRLLWRDAENGIVYLLTADGLSREEVLTLANRIEAVQ